MDHAEVKQRMRALWTEGDWPAIAAHLDGAARALVEECGIGPAHRVLDVAAGNGNAAVWAARAGARVTATDLCPLLVDQGRRRCAAEGLEVEWREADMEELPFADSSFDSVLSAFGLGFAPRLELALGEMFRVARPGGCIGVLNWTRHGWPAQVGAIMERHLHGTSDASTPRRDPGGAFGLWLLEHAAAVRMERGVVWQRFASPEEWWRHWHAASPQMALARRKLSEEGYGHLRDELMASVDAAATAEGDGCRWPSEYLIVVAAKRPASNGNGNGNGHAAPGRARAGSSA